VWGSRTEHLYSVDLNSRLGIVRSTEIVKWGHLGWFGHLERKDSDDYVSACRNFEVSQPKSKGRCRKTWDECVRHDLHFMRFHTSYLLLWWIQSWRMATKGSERDHHLGVLGSAVSVPQWGSGQDSSYSIIWLAPCWVRSIASAINAFLDSSCKNEHSGGKIFAYWL